MAKQNKKAYAIYEKGKLVDCHFIKGVAVDQVDRLYGKGLFSRPWEGNKKGDYEIAECDCEYDAVYVVDSSLVHSEENPTIFPSLNALADYLKERGLKIRRKETRARRFSISTDRGILKGRIVNVK